MALFFLAYLICVLLLNDNVKAGNFPDFQSMYVGIFSSIYQYHE